MCRWKDNVESDLEEILVRSGLDCFGPRRGPVASSCEHDIKPVVTCTAENFLISWARSLRNAVMCCCEVLYYLSAEQSRILGIILKLVSIQRTDSSRLGYVTSTVGRRGVEKTVVGGVLWWDWGKPRKIWPVSALYPGISEYEAVINVVCYCVQRD